MKYFIYVFFVCGLVAGLLLNGCGAKKEASGGAAIEIAKTMDTEEQKIDYLMGQAEAFYKADQFQDTVTIAQYILQNLDKDSAEARDMLNKATDEMRAMMQKSAESIKKSLGGQGK
jgi:predicted RNA-binding protein with EMAP domain